MKIIFAFFKYEQKTYIYRFSINVFIDFFIYY